MHIHQGELFSPDFASAGTALLLPSILILTMQDQQHLVLQPKEHQTIRLLHLQGTIQLRRQPRELHLEDLQ
jgi:hypothetical protein